MAHDANGSFINVNSVTLIFTKLHAAKGECGRGQERKLKLENMQGGGGQVRILVHAMVSNMSRI